MEQPTAYFDSYGAAVGEDANAFNLTGRMALP